jgi:uncharacterized protein (DUF2164 family)
VPVLLQHYIRRTGTNEETEDNEEEKTYMTQITLDKAQREAVVAKLKDYFEQELDQSIGQFDAEFLLDFFADTIGVYFYNKGLADARQLVGERLASIDDALYEIERPV